MDEAHIATNEDFQQYVKRIFTIFLDNPSTTKDVNVSSFIIMFQ